MYWVEASPEQSVPQTPPIFQRLQRSSHSPGATVPEEDDLISSQQSQGEANVPSTPVSQTNVQNFRTSTTPLQLNSRRFQSRYGTPLLEIVLLKSAQRHTIDSHVSAVNESVYYRTLELEQTVPSTPKQNTSRESLLSPSDQLEHRQTTEDKYLHHSNNRFEKSVKKQFQNLELFTGDEIFPK